MYSPLYSFAKRFTETNITCPNGWEFPLEWFDECIDIFWMKAGFILGLIELFIWFIALTPQILLNVRNKHSGAFTVTFIGCWIIGDLLNLIVVILTEQITVIKMIALFYLFPDFILLLQLAKYGPANDPRRNVQIPGIIFGTIFLQQNLFGSQNIQLSETLSAVPLHYLVITAYILSLIAAGFYVTGRYHQCQRNAILKNADYLSPILFMLSIIANVLHIACIIFQMDTNNAGNYFFMHLPSLLCVLCIPFDAIILWQIYEAKQQNEYVLYQQNDALLEPQQQQQQRPIIVQQSTVNVV
uniref:Uncharacterized protein n=1 Tax=Panagrolaimus sp. PS1159 TaxID=55785 RepID=A0AC35GVV8_9BILA